MKRYLHLNESEFRSLIKNIIKEVEEKEFDDDNQEKNAFLVCSEDFKDFDAIIEIVDALDAECEEQDKGVYLIRCNNKDDVFALKRILDSFKKDSLNNHFVHGKKVNTRTNYPNEVSDLEDLEFDSELGPDFESDFDY
jgi:hypothetical protein